jgi:hypothetical protein
MRPVRPPGSTEALKTRYANLGGLLALIVTEGNHQGKKRANEHLWVGGRRGMRGPVSGTSAGQTKAGDKARRIRLLKCH